MATKLTLRNTKGSPLTFQEGDDNFLYVDGKATAGIAIGKVYDTKEAGLAAVRDTDTFWVQGSGDIGAILYRRDNSTTATELKRVLSDQFKTDLADPAKGAGMVAFNGMNVSDALSMTLPGDIGRMVNSMARKTGEFLYFRKNSESQFEIFTPFIQKGRYLKWRFDNDESQFGANPTDIQMGYTRPFIQTTVTDTRLEERVDTPNSEFQASSSKTVAGANTYISGVGNYFEITGIRASRIRISYFAANNACKFKVTINGGARLVNLIPKDENGDAVIDAYVPSGSSTRPTFIAENLPDIDLAIRLEVVGQNQASLGDRLYLNTAGSMSKYAPFSGAGVPTESVVNGLKLGGSAVDYAISFRPAELENSSTAFIGSVHGWENRTALEIYLDQTKEQFDQLEIGGIVVASSVSIFQKTDVFHWDKLEPRTANAETSWTFTENGAAQGVEWIWDQPAFVANGYTQMWTVVGGNVGGEGGPKNGWCDRVWFKGHGSYDLSFGGRGEFGHHITDEIVFCGTPKESQDTTRNSDSGDTACVVTLADVSRSFMGFKSPVSVIDGIWVQDRPTFKKMYLQSYRGIGVVPSGFGHKSGMTIQFMKSPRIYDKLSRP